MTPEAAMDRINLILAHAWMVRNFLKHADEAQEDNEMLDVHRMIFDYSRAVEPSLQRRDAAEYLRRAKGKLSKLKKAAEFFHDNYPRVSSHTNFQMAAISLKFVVLQIEEVLAQVDTPQPGADAGEERDAGV
jgi:predicted translin family RNA/ssDNA-binding protein